VNVTAMMPPLVHTQHHQTSSALACLEWAHPSRALHLATLLACCVCLMLHWLARLALHSTGLGCCQPKYLTGEQLHQRRRQHFWLLCDVQQLRTVESAALSSLSWGEWCCVGMYG
jgi:hypothetical protein